MQFDTFDIDGFLRNYWQKEPLLIRNPWTAWCNPLDPDELAGLACEDDVESRLIRSKRGTWKLEHGPFGAARFAKLGKTPWTLLVQAVDAQVADVARLIDPFRFVPNWRVDDVMVSYASDGGGVGPHFDQYDVFLIQGLGQRHWQVGALCDRDTELLPHDDLRLLAKFEATDEWLLEPGDILYLPPRVAHNGIAVGDDCMTYSVGFRAPSRSELVGNWCDDLLGRMQEDDRYTDPNLVAQANSGEISAVALNELHAMITDTLGDRAAFARWFGEYNSAPKSPDADWRPEKPIGIAKVRELIAGGTELRQNPASRFSFVRQGAGAVLLFVDGQGFACAGEAAVLAERLSSQDQVVLGAELNNAYAVMELIVELFNQGSVAFDCEN